MLFEVLQGSVLGPILFILYVCHQLQLHGYADDTQIYAFCNPADVDILQERISNCFEDVTAWTLTNRKNPV